MKLSRSCSLGFLGFLGAATAVACSTSCHAEPDEGPPVAIRPAARKATPPLPPCDAQNDPLLTASFVDRFDRGEIGNDWRTTSYAAYFTKNNRLCFSKPRNHPLWLKRRLPTNVRVEFDAVAYSNNADVKAEIFGDGCYFDQEGREYAATAYVAVLGAHGNSEHWLARLAEHGPEAKKTPLIAGGETIANSKLLQSRTYHVELARTDGKELTFKVDGVVVHTFADDSPLTGPGHDHFGFNGWDAPVCFDNLTITPLP